MSNNKNSFIEFVTDERIIFLIIWIVFLGLSILDVINTKTFEYTSFGVAVGALLGYKRSIAKDTKKDKKEE